MHAGSRAGMLLGGRCVVAADSCCQTSTAEAFKLSRGCAAHCAKFAPVCEKKLCAAGAILLVTVVQGEFAVCLES